jgi:hypothetical protein
VPKNGKFTNILNNIKNLFNAIKGQYACPHPQKPKVEVEGQVTAPQQKATHPIPFPPHSPPIPLNIIYYKFLYLLLSSSSSCNM